jgi:hypothetical protein
MRWWASFLVAGSLLGCAEDPPALPDISAGVAVSWTDAPKSSAEVGFTIAVLVTQRPPQGAAECRQLPASARFTINGEEVSDLATTSEGCLDLQVATLPLLEWKDAPVTVVYEEEGREVGRGEFRGLSPGTAATLSVPASGEARPGEEIVIRPPPGLPTSLPGYASFFPLDESSSTTWSPSGVLSGGAGLIRSADGIHVTVPLMVGRAAVTMTGMPYAPRAEVACTGFAACVAIADNTLGPVFVKVLP